MTTRNVPCSALIPSKNLVVAESLSVKVMKSATTMFNYFWLIPIDFFLLIALTPWNILTFETVEYVSVKYFSQGILISKIFKLCYCATTRWMVMKVLHHRISKILTVVAIITLYVISDFIAKSWVLPLDFFLKLYFLNPTIWNSSICALISTLLTERLV